MRIVQPVAWKPNYFDRDAENVTIYYDAGGIEPHYITERASYTVPEGRKAIIDAIMVRCYRQSMASVLGITRLIVAYIPNGGSPTYLYYKILYDNELYHDVVHTMTNVGVMLPGDALAFYTDDSSTGGTHLFQFTAKIFEFV